VKLFKVDAKSQEQVSLATKKKIRKTDLGGATNERSVMQNEV